MDDFITLQCPNCGGKLSVSGNATSLKCEHCGTEHMIRREAGNVILESYARCPVCNRNDRAEKVSAILRSQTQNSQGVTYQMQTTTVRVGDSYFPVSRQVAVPIQSSQVSVLAKHLVPPLQPNPSIIYNSAAQADAYKPTHTILALTIALGVAGIISLLCSALAIIAMLGGGTTKAETVVVTVILLGLLTIALIGAGLLLFIFAVPRENQKNTEKKIAAEAKTREMQASADEQLRRWKLAMEKWNRLYYCGRDDCVFMPGANSSAPISDMIKYIYQI
jgi:predicted RNA-binding Zn-ribbon protein involved in translation (DUF1610 family)